nr:hypothetical protein [Candidatus Micrarchaeota archaeon]
MKRLIVLFILLLPFAWTVNNPALGLRTVASCDSDPKVIRPAEYMTCYHAAAITSAYMGNVIGARNACLHIWDKYSSDPAFADTDIPKKAELITNNCFFDVAKIIARTKPNEAEDMCRLIFARSVGQQVDTGLLGGVVNQDVCIDDVNRLYQTSPQNYWGKSDNICAIVYLLPLLLLGSLRIRVRP